MYKAGIDEGMGCLVAAYRGNCFGLHHVADLDHFYLVDRCLDHGCVVALDLALCLDYLVHSSSRMVETSLACLDHDNFLDVCSHHTALRPDGHAVHLVDPRNGCLDHRVSVCSLVGNGYGYGEATRCRIAQIQNQMASIDRCGLCLIGQYDCFS